MGRTLRQDGFVTSGPLGAGLTVEMLAAGVQHAYQVLDAIDERLLENDSPRLAGLVELANLSTIVGNLLAMGIVNACDGVFSRAGPHKYQDLRATDSNPDAQNIEIKVALETNSPKGHLPKVGHYLTCRYVLGNQKGCCVAGRRGDVVWIWELRFGHLDQHHFTTSSTPGDSGKTAVVNKDGMAALRVAYVDMGICPYGPRSQYRKQQSF